MTSAAVAAVVVVCSSLGATDTLIDRVIAVVDKAVVTESELLVEARVALAYREGGEAASAELASELVSGLRDYLVNQLLIASSARRMGAADVSEADVDRRMRRFTQAFASAAAYEAFQRRFGISEAAVRRIMQREQRNETYIREQMRSRLLTTASGSRDHSQRYQEAFKRWLGELRAGVEIRMIGADGQLEVAEP